MTTKLETALARLGIEETSRRNGAIKARCPNRDHEDVHPSWSIKIASPSPHHCFSCSFSGNLVTLAAYVRRTTNAAAEEWLATLGADEPEQTPMACGARMEVTSSQKRGFVLPPEVVFRPLEKWATPPREYLIGRGVTEDQVARWSLGYAVDGRLAGRVVIPIWKTYGKVAASYVARAFSSDEKRILCPSGHENPDQDVLWGEIYWQNGGLNRSIVIVTEGAFDGMAVERVMDARDSVYVAALGGSPSPVRPIHVAKLAAFGAVIVLTDPDVAGDRCAADLLAQLRRHTLVERVRLKEGYDANKVPEDELRRTLWPVLSTLYARIT